MIEIIILISLSLLIGGVIVRYDGMKGLLISLVGIFALLALYMGLRGILVAAIGIFLLMVVWFISELKKPASRLYKSYPEKKKIKLNRDKDLVDLLRKSFQENLASKYPGRNPRSK